MANIKPFRAIRPKRDKVHLVVSRPVYTYKPSILAAKLEENPYTFIQIIHPEFFEDIENKTEPNSNERFQKVREKYLDFIGDGIFIQEEEPALYIYRQSTETHVFTGIIGGASVDEYNEGKIKKHEATLSSREEMFTRYLDIVGMNAEPVLLCHKPNAKLTDLITEHTTLNRPEYEFTTTDKTTHELWVVQGDDKEALIQAYQMIEETYIADGHHRSASSAGLYNKLQEEKTPRLRESTKYFLSFLIDDEQLDIQPYNRICKTLNGLTKNELLERLENDFEVKHLQEIILPQKMHDIHLIIENESYCLRIKEHHLQDFTTLQQIDAEILSKYILDPILGIKDLKTDPMIKFIPGHEGVEGMQKELEKKQNKIGFMLFPVSTEQLMQVADENEIMPPKSTWINPKLRSGLTIYNLFE